MPRKIVPRTTGGAYRPIVRRPFKRSHVRRIILDSNAPISLSKLSLAKTRLTEIAGRYRRWHQRGAQAYNRSEAVRDLTWFAQKSAADELAVFSLNERAQQELYDTFIINCYREGRGYADFFNTLAAGTIEPDELRAAAAMAVDKLKAQKGADPKGELYFTIGEILELYEELSAKRATHSNKGPRLTHQQASTSVAGRFTTACMRHIDPSIRDHAISTAIRSWRAARNAQDKAE